MLRYIFGIGLGYIDPDISLKLLKSVSRDKLNDRVVRKVLSRPGGLPVICIPAFLMKS